MKGEKQPLVHIITHACLLSLTPFSLSLPPPSFHTAFLHTYLGNSPCTLQMYSLVNLRSRICWSNSRDHWRDLVRISSPEVSQSSLCTAGGGGGGGSESFLTFDRANATLLVTYRRDGFTAHLHLTRAL